MSEILSIEIQDNDQRLTEYGVHLDIMFPGRKEETLMSDWLLTKFDNWLDKILHEAKKMKHLNNLDDSVKADLGV